MLDVLEHVHNPAILHELTKYLNRWLFIVVCTQLQVFENCADNVIAN